MPPCPWQGTTQGSGRGFVLLLLPLTCLGTKQPLLLQRPFQAGYQPYMPQLPVLQTVEQPLAVPQVPQLPPLAALPPLPVLPQTPALAQPAPLFAAPAPAPLFVTPALKQDSTPLLQVQRPIFEVPEEPLSSLDRPLERRGLQVRSTRELDSLDGWRQPDLSGLDKPPLERRSPGLQLPMRSRYQQPAPTSLEGASALTLLQDELVRVRSQLADEAAGEKLLQARNAELAQRLAATQDQLTASVQDRQRMGGQLNQASTERERWQAAQRAAGEAQAEVERLRQERQGLLDSLASGNRSSKVLQDQVQLLQQQRDLASAQAKELAMRDGYAESQLSSARQRTRELEDQLGRAQSQLGSLARNFTEQLERAQAAREQRRMGRSLEQELLAKMQVERDEMMQREGKYKAMLEQVVQQEAEEKRALLAFRAQSQQAVAELNRTQEERVLLLQRLDEARERLNATGLRSSLLQQDAEKRLREDDAKVRGLQALLEEERAQGRQDRAARQRLEQERDADRANLEQSDQLLRGGEVRLQAASKELAQAEQRSKLLQYKTAEQEALVNKSQSEVEAMKKRLLIASAAVQHLSAKTSLLEEKSKRLRMLPWAELLGRCQADVCFTLAHRVACCGGPRDIVAQRPDACDLAARVASGLSAPPEICGPAAPAPPAMPAA